MPLLLLLLTGLGPATWHAANRAAICHVEPIPRTLQAGDVAFVLARCDAGLARFRARLGAAPLAFFPLEPSARATPPDGPVLLGALLGIDLETVAGTRDLAWEAEFDEDSEGREAKGSNVVRIGTRTFPVDRLTLSSAFVDPAAAALVRIRAERRRMTAVLALRTPARLWRGSFLLPIPAAGGGGFGARRILNGRSAAPHAGVDLRAPAGEAVFAPNHGTAVLVDTLFFGGKTVVLDHGLGLFTTYSHLSQLSVFEGDRVERGQLLGRVGATGRVTGPHLHWAAHLGGARVDPLSLIAATRGAVYETPELRMPVPRD